MADVAARAGVSVATVSRALRDVSGVSHATRARIREIAGEMAYVVSPEASGLSRRATRRVAVVVPRVDVWFYATLVGELERQLRAAELDVLLYQADGEGERSQFVRELPARRKVDAIVLVAMPLSIAEAERLGTMMGTEVVVAGGHMAQFIGVHADDHGMATEAVRHLADHGHDRIAMIRTDDTRGTVWSSDVERTRGYLDVVRNRGLAADLMMTVPYSADSGARAMSQLMALKDPPTAVFAYSDELAVGAFGFLTSRRIRVPEDVSIIGVDGNPVAASLALDTVDQQVSTQGRLAGRLVAERLGLYTARPDSYREDLIVRHALVTRGSVGAPRSGPVPRRRR